jgi:anaerobic selenocysteine-containing dehydrogenase
MRTALPRLTQPLVRDRLADGGRGPLRPATWDEALDRAAAGLGASVAAPRPQELRHVLLLEGDQRGQLHRAEVPARAVIGSNNIDSCNRT